MAKRPETTQEWLDRYEKKRDKGVREWIPCSERLPIAEHGESDTVIVTKCWKKDRDIRFVGEAMFDGGNWCTPTGEVLAAVDVIAWMPLPEPWKGDKNEKSDYSDNH